VLAITSRFSALLRAAGAASAMSRIFAAKPCLAATFLASAASRSALPDSVAKRMVSGRLAGLAAASSAAGEVAAW
jgi:hypothetical protein